MAEISAKTFLDTYKKLIAKKDIDIYIKNSFDSNAIKKEIKNKSLIFLIASINGIPVGYAKLKKGNKLRNVNVEPNSIEIVRMYIDKKFIGKGIGKMLMQECLRIAKDAGCRNVWLGVWEKNSDAIAFYRKMGFKEFGSYSFKLNQKLLNDLLFKKAVK